MAAGRKKESFFKMPLQAAAVSDIIERTNTARALRRPRRIMGGLDLPMFEKCKKVDIIEKTGALICQARVSVGHSGEVLLVIPRAAAYKPNSLYRVVFYDPVLGRVTCRCRLSASLPLPGGELCSLRCEILEQLSQEQRRQDVKIPLDTTVMLHAVYQPGDVSRVPESGVPTTIVNISAGGVYLRAPLLLDKGRRVWFDFQIDKEILTLSAQILRRENAALSNSHQLLYGYGCKFINMLSKHEAALRSFIFQQQRQQRKQE